MKHFLLFLVIFNGVYGDLPLNLDSVQLLIEVRSYLEKTLKTMADIPALKEEARSNYTRNVKESLASYVQCPGVQVLKRNLQSISNSSAAYTSTLECIAKLDRGTNMIDNLYNKAVWDQIATLFGQIDNLTHTYKPKIEKMKKKLSEYVVKFDVPCTMDELKKGTCGALLEFEQTLQLYRIKIHQYTVKLTLAASFVGEFADNAWATVEKRLKYDVIEPVNNCIDEHDLDSYYGNVQH